MHERRAYRHARRAERWLAAALFLAAPAVARGAILLSANDGHTVLGPSMSLSAAPSPVPDTLSVIDLTDAAPRIAATIEVPTSVVGPPTAVWVAPDESWAIVTAANRADASAPSGLAADDLVSVIDLTAKPPRVVQQLHAGAGATTVRVSPDGTLALICNRVAGTVSVFSVHDRRLTDVGPVMLAPHAGPGGLVFSADGRFALVSRFFDNQISVLHIDGLQVTVDPRPLTAGVAPYTMDVTADGRLAAVANMGRGDGDADTVSFIDMKADPPRVVATHSVGQTPEGIAFSHDGRILATALINGTNRPKDSPGWHAAGRLVLWTITPQFGLELLAEAPIGRWSQGVAFSPGGRLVFVQNMVEHTISVFRFDGRTLTPGTPLSTGGAGPAALGQAALGQAATR